MSALQDRRILITGAGSGIGAVTAGLAVDAGARVALLDRDGAAAEVTATRLGRANALPIAGDVTDAGAIERALGAMDEAWGGIDDLVNNAGTWDHDPLLELTLERWRRVFEVNLMAPIAIARAAVPPPGPAPRRR